MTDEILAKNLNRFAALSGKLILIACVEPGMVEPITHFVMAYNYQFIQRGMQRQHKLRLAHECLRHTFTAAFGLLQSIGALVTLIIIALVRDNPLLILHIFYLYCSLFIVAMVISFFAWWKYKRFYKSVFK